VFKRYQPRIIIAMFFFRVKSPLQSGQALVVFHCLGLNLLVAT
jgi:hypothetical protein